MLSAACDLDPNLLLAFVPGQNKAEPKWHISSAIYHSATRMKYVLAMQAK